MRETRITLAQLTVGDMIVKVGKQEINSRLRETRELEKGTQLVGPRGGRKVLNGEGVRQGGTALVCANGRKPVAFADTTIVVLRDDMDW